MAGLCEICGAPSRGFGWFKPPEHAGKTKSGYRAQRPERKLFCSMRCLDIHTKNVEKGNIMAEQYLQDIATETVIAPLAEYVCDVGMEKPLQHYTKKQILGMIKVVVQSHQEKMRELVSDDISF